MQPATLLVASPALAGIGGVATALTGAPWWVTTLVLGVAVIQTVFPQESGDRLEWYRDRRRHQRLASGKNTACHKPRHAWCRDLHLKRPGRSVPGREHPRCR
ncbi:hypothetical protein HCN51_56090 [Nonomuraea sp. FMUSA5-5]|uniref:Uncharacterized protein n=1 Tax=Nonomuraea composti TaxID=2720023 RepID=A0ABX1BTJ2_9ACTN|nr:hypothetical protein [Nonomuraea sp. FMUSA5-5]NJP98646.1 hypothetical protein [Nonomuraea sp. FMUSA5-5]